MSSISTQIRNEYNKADIALHMDLAPGRRNQYNRMMVSDVKSLAWMYFHLIQGDYHKALNIYVGLDTAVVDEIPVRIVNAIELIAENA